MKLKQWILAGVSGGIIGGTMETLIKPLSLWACWQFWVLIIWVVVYSKINKYLESK